MRSDTVRAVTSDVPYSRRHIRAAWAVHALTGTGVIVGYAGLNAVVAGDARASILWLVAALVVDGVDGPIARRLDVSARIPTLDGNALDLIIDYFTCTIVPVAFLYRFDLLPHLIGGPTGFAILFVSAMWMARRDQETLDGWFRGFPAEWNMIIPTLFLLRTSPWFNLSVCVALCGFTLSRVEFPHPLSVRAQRPISIAFLVAWVVAMVCLACTNAADDLTRVALAVAPGWTVYQVVRRNTLTPAATDAAVATRA